MPGHRPGAGRDGCPAAHRLGGAMGRLSPKMSWRVAWR